MRVKRGKAAGPDGMRKNASRLKLIAAALAAGAVGAAALPAMAQAAGTQRPAVQPPQLSPVAAARKAVNDAATALAQAKRDQDTVVSGVQKWFDQKPDFAAAEEKVKKAQADYDATIKPIKQAVESSDAYQELVAKKVEAQKTLDESGNPNGGVSDEDVSKAADVVVKSRLAMINMEAEALNNDAKVAQAKEALKEAKEELAALQQQVTDALSTNPDYIAAEKLVEQKPTELQVGGADGPVQHPEKSSRPAPRPVTPRKRRVITGV